MQPSAASNSPGAPHGAQRKDPFLVVRFNHLPRAVRENWVRLARGAEGDGVVGFTARPAGGAGLGIVGAIAIGFALVTPQMRGVTESSIQAVTAVCTFIAVAALVPLVVKLVRPHPWVRGEYLFPGAWVSAHENEFFIATFDDLPAPTVVTISTGGTSVKRQEVRVFGASITKPGNADAKLLVYQNARATYHQARAAGIAAAMRMMNPFYDCEAAGRWEVSPVEPGGPRAGAGPMTWKIGMVLAALSAGAVYFLQGAP